MGDDAYDDDGGDDDEQEDANDDGTCHTCGCGSSAQDV